MLVIGMVSLRGIAVEALSFVFSVKGRLFWLALFVVSLMGLADLPEANLFTGELWIRYLGFGLVACLKATLLTGFYGLLKGNVVMRVAAIVLLSGYTLACVANFGCYSLYGFGISHRMMTVLAQTNADEAAEFMPGLASNLISSVFSLKGVTVMAAIAASVFLIRIPGRKSYLTMLCALTAGGAVSLVLLALPLESGRNTFFMSLRVPKNVLETYRENKEIERLMGSLRPLPDADKVRSEHKAEVIVMVVGESVSRGHMSVYGYPIVTTPVFDSLADSLFLFTDAIGSSSSTAGNMERILSFKPDDTTSGDWMRYPLLIDLFKEAGYRTYWLSNQERAGIWSNSSGVMASRADVVEYVGSESSEDALLQRYDEILLPRLRAALDHSGSPLFVGMHLLGSHTRYVNRYPAVRGRITASDIMRVSDKPWINESKAATVAEYDNSIAYTDSILGVVVKAIAADSRPAVMVYLSDHGENVYDDRDFLGRDRVHVEVPLVVYVNRAYREANPDMEGALAGAIGLPVSTANIVYSIMTLSGTDYPAYDATRDFLSPEFVKRKRYVDERIWEYDGRKTD